MTKDTPGFLVCGLARARAHLHQLGHMHELYFGNLGGDGKVRPARCRRRWPRRYGGLARWEELFRATGASLGGGSGWTVLALEPPHRRAAHLLVRQPHPGAGLRRAAAGDGHVRARLPDGLRRGRGEVHRRLLPEPELGRGERALRAGEEGRRRAQVNAGPGDDAGQVSMKEIFWYFLKLGWLAFGGPVGQIGLMHLEVVERRKWLSEEEFLDALNFCHVLPGPEALQLAIYLGWKKRGNLAGLLAGVLFIVPGFITLTALAWVYVNHGKRPEVLGVLWGFRPVGLALLVAALVRISRAALKGVLPVVLALAAFLAFFVAKLPFILVLLGCGVFFVLWKKRQARAAVTSVGLLLTPGWARAADSIPERLFDISWFFLKVGLFSFGGAYAALPLMREGSVLTHGWLTDPQMIDALALGETTPGPLISIGIFVGFLAGHQTGAGFLGAVAATFWLFLPSFVFVLGAAPHMRWLTAKPGVKDFLKGVTSGVVGLMFSISIPLAGVAFMPNGELDWITVVLGLAAFAALTFWKWRLNVVAVVLAGGVLGLLRAFAPAL